MWSAGGVTLLAMVGAGVAVWQRARPAPAQVEPAGAAPVEGARADAEPAGDPAGDPAGPESAQVDVHDVVVEVGDDGVPVLPGREGAGSSPMMGRRWPSMSRGTGRPAGPGWRCGS